MKDDQLLTVRELATRLGVHRGTVYGWIRDEKLGHERVGPDARMLRIAEQDAGRMRRRRRPAREGG